MRKRFGGGGGEEANRQIERFNSYSASHDN